MRRPSPRLKTPHHTPRLDRPPQNAPLPRAPLRQIRKISTARAIGPVPPALLQTRRHDRLLRERGRSALRARVPSDVEIVVGAVALGQADALGRGEAVPGGRVHGAGVCEGGGCGDRADFFDVGGYAGGGGGGDAGRCAVRGPGRLVGPAGGG